MTTDHELIGRIAERDQTAFETFYRRHVGSIVALGTRRCRDAHEVSELCALVFLAVWERAAAYDPARGDARSWLFGIASNRFVDLRRGDRRRTALAARLIERRVLEPNDIDRLTDAIDAARAAGDVVAAVRELPDAQRQALTMVAVDGLSAVEAARELDTTPTAVRMRLSRARRTVRQTIDPPHDDAAEVAR
ncbi:MAG: RNA polymerase sigma factor [Acidimicrobiales bacterium]